MDEYTYIVICILGREYYVNTYAHTLDVSMCTNLMVDNNYAHMDAPTHSQQYIDCLFKTLTGILRRIASHSSSF